MSDLFPHGTVWVLCDYVDSVQERKVSAVRRDNEIRERFRQKPLVTFSTAPEAWQAAVERATKRVADAEKELRNERTRLRRCQKRLAETEAM